MSVPSLPLDLIIVIASHFETNPFRAEERKVQEQVETAKALSLVCRAWRPIGQGLRWRSLRISESLVPSLVNHIALYPRLAKFIRAFNFTESLRNAPGGGYSQAQNIELLPPVLASLANLRFCVISGNVGQHLVAILRSLSTLEGLEGLGLFGTSYTNWSDEMEAIFSSGYEKLWYLAFCMENLSLSSQSDLTLRLGAPPKSLQSWLDWSLYCLRRKVLSTPLSPQSYYPQIGVAQRLRHILEDSKISLGLSQSHHALPQSFDRSTSERDEQHRRRPSSILGSQATQDHSVRHLRRSFI
ncbi:hypothetical protein JCM3765_004014 [Sporobolomyces pararoseus]